MANATYSYLMTALGTNRKFSIRGTGDDITEAKAEADAKLKLTVGTIVGSSQSVRPASGVLGTAHDAGTYEDATLTMTRLGFTKVVPLENISTEYLLAGSDGFIDVDHEDITDFASAWADGNGVTGWLAASGRYKV